MNWYKCIVGNGGGPSVEALIDHSILLANTFIQPSNGQEGSSGEFSATPFIEVEPGEILTFAAKTNGSYYFSWYDENQSWLNSFILADYGWITQVVPNNAHYARFSNQDTNMAHLQVWRGL